MKIRAITLGVPLEHEAESLDGLKTKLELVSELKEQFSEHDTDVQTVRFCTTPYNAETVYNDDFFTQIPHTLEFIDSLTKHHLLDFYSYLPGLCDQTSELSPTQKRVFEALPQHFANHPVMFSSIQVSSVSNGLSLQAIQKCANLIKSLADKDPFVNLQFAATFNVPPNTPFFPSAYHEGHEPKISIALEAADEFVKITQEWSEYGNGLKWLEDNITKRFSEIYDDILKLIDPFCSKYGFKYSGMDFSPSQYPEREKSIGTAVENLKLSHFGEVGTIFAIGFLTSALQKTPRPKIGFSGFMQPLLEDYMIAIRHDEGKFDLTQMLLNSTVCGLGLDCIPLPGDISNETLTLLMMDVAMLSTRLKKPLTCRLMPIPGKTHTDRTQFNFEYFTNSKICDVKPSSLSSNLKEFLKRNSGFLF